MASSIEGGMARLSMEKGEEGTKTITLVASDGEAFEVEDRVAMLMLGTLRNKIEGGGGCATGGAAIPLPNIKGKAAYYLSIESLLDLTSQKVADMIKGKSLEEIRKRFNITNDLTPEEEEQSRRENQWAFE